MELQKNKSLPSSKGHSIGMKVKLHSFAIVIAVLSRSSVRLPSRNYLLLPYIWLRVDGKRSNAINEV